MMKTTLLSIIAGLLALGSPALLAQEASTNKPPAAVHKNAAQTDKRLEAIGLTRADLKGLTPDERKAKIKQATETKVTELNAKETAGTITDQEKKQLAALQRRLDHPKKPAVSQ